MAKVVVNRCRFPLSVHGVYGSGLDEALYILRLSSPQS